MRDFISKLMHTLCHRLTALSASASALAQAARDSHSRLQSSAAAAQDHATMAEQLANDLLQMRLQLQEESRKEAGRRYVQGFSTLSQIGQLLFQHQPKVLEGVM